VIKHLNRSGAEPQSDTVEVRKKLFREDWMGREQKNSRKYILIFLIAGAFVTSDSEASQL
jgi:hypothetical protein